MASFTLERKFNDILNKIDSINKKKSYHFSNVINNESYNYFKKYLRKNIYSNRNSFLNISDKFITDLNYLHQQFSEYKKRFLLDDKDLKIAYEKNNFFSFNDFKEKSYFEISLIENDKDFISLPIFFDFKDNKVLLSTSDEILNDCSCYAGKIGIIYINKEVVRNKFNIKKITKNWLDELKELMKNEIELQNCY